MRRIASLIRCQKGLTLLELLIAMAILSLILVILGSALRISYNAIAAKDRNIDRVHRARVITEQIAQELRSAYSLPSLRAGEEVKIFRGGPDRISFVTTTPLRSRGITGSGLKEVTYSVGEDAATGRKGLLLREDLIPHGELFEEGKGYQMVLDTTVRELRCRYLGSPENKDEAARPPGWEESWEGDRLPKAVEVQLVFQEPERGAALELPPVTMVLPVEKTLEAEK